MCSSRGPVERVRPPRLSATGASEWTFGTLLCHNAGARSYEFALPRKVALKGMGDVDVYDLIAGGAG